VLNFFQNDHSCIQILGVQVEPIIDKNMSILCYSSLKSRPVDGALSVDFYGISTVNNMPSARRTGAPSTLGYQEMEYGFALSRSE
jgi:hypothetical protein